MPHDLPRLRELVQERGAAAVRLCSHPPGGRGEPGELTSLRRCEQEFAHEVKIVEGEVRAARVVNPSRRAPTRLHCAADGRHDVIGVGGAGLSSVPLQGGLPDLFQQTMRDFLGGTLPE